MEAGADDNATYDFRKFFKEAGQNDPLSADHSDSSSAAPDHRRKL